nr:hypothetical protein GCM10020241_31840 [Streptoalloteichus tenebrarius]
MSGAAGRVAARSAAAVLSALLATSVVGAATANAAPTAPDGSRLAPSVPGAQPLPVDPVEGKIAPRLADAHGEVTAFVELEKKPAADAFAEKQGQGAGKDQAKQAAQQARQETRQAADKVVAALRAKDADTKVSHRTSNAVPGVVVTADADKVKELAALPEVKAVQPISPVERTNSSAVQLTRTVKAWQDAGKLGDGVRIGIIDDGIDYTHATFGGPGTKGRLRRDRPHQGRSLLLPHRQGGRRHRPGRRRLRRPGQDRVQDAVPRPQPDLLRPPRHARRRLHRRFRCQRRRQHLPRRLRQAGRQAAQRDAHRAGHRAQGAPLLHQGVRLRRLDQPDDAGAGLGARP